MPGSPVRPHCQFQRLNLSPYIDLPAAFDMVGYSISLGNVFSLGFWTITPFGSLLSLASQFLLLAHLHLFTLQHLREQPLDLTSSVSSFPGDLLPFVCQQSSSYNSTADLSLHAISIYSIIYSPRFLGCRINITVMTGPRLNCFFLQNCHPYFRRRQLPSF